MLTGDTHLARTCRTWQRLQDILDVKEIKVDGNSLDTASVVAVAQLSEDPLVARKINDSVRMLMDHLDNNYCVYGVNTGFGGSADSRTDSATALQAALLQLTQAGVLVETDKHPNAGNSNGRLQSHSMPATWVRGSMIIRCNTNARGHSAVSLPVLESLLALLRQRITPIVPLRGSISASGDLIPLSYIAGTIEGSPDVFVQVQNPDSKDSRIMSARDALLQSGIELRSMGPKEGLGLVNGTAFSSSVGALALYETNHLAILAQALSAMGLEALTGNAECLAPFIQQVRPHDGQIECARNVLHFLQGSHLAYGIRQTQSRHRTGLAQDRYAFRSVPQWLGPYLEDLLLADQQITTELNSTSDNPLIDTESNRTFSGANFQATAITSAMEKTRLVLQMFGRLVSSQATELIDPNFNNGLPTNLVADDPSLSFTMKGLDITLAAYMAELSYLAGPVSSHVQPAEMRNQAVNSMALVSARYSMQAIDLVSLICATGLYITCQALDLRVLHLTFLQKIPFAIQDLTVEHFSDHLPPHDLAILSRKISLHIEESWPTTTRLSLPMRCQSVIHSTSHLLLDTFANTNTNTTTNPLPTIHAFQTAATKTLSDIYHSTRSHFLTHPSQTTTDFLGLGSKALYRFVREDLRVPFHRGLEDHPTAKGYDCPEGRQKRTVGSWVSVIYEAIRKDGAMRALGGVLEGVEGGG
ncbi:phenylalanine ammonia-lyase [Aspergillus steynii IBT 23096]|uniref:Phenylalanine ammonia-lyase n=1 Tax=Aspergillus steynii IBT 23096 TaxID=1392250 RepID=A0A2I2FWR4_9EURO|nr:phenylalanine ammonia-lyase [Aspergillus steynii IBT 23096]PLB45082.1 phenylalanine ammonia-lyase [Aspergillus steynii IBT 23096]